MGTLRYDGPEELALHALPIPRPGARQVLVEVRFATVNPADALPRAGGTVSLINDPPPYVGGLEMSGVIVAVGPDSRWNGGERVAAITSFIQTGKGCHCGHAVVDDDSVALVPEGYGLAEAAGLPMSGLTARLALDRALQAGSRIAITGAAGAVGSLAVSLAIEDGLIPLPLSARTRARRCARSAHGTSCPRTTPAPRCERWCRTVSMR